MNTVPYIYWKDGKVWLGYLEDYPDYMTQGKTQKELRESLRDLYRDVTGGRVPGVRRVGQLQIP